MSVDSPYKFHVRLSAAQLVPPLELNNSATLYLKFHKDFEYLYYDLHVKNGDNVTQVQLRQGSANDPVGSGALLAYLVRNGVSGTTSAPLAETVNGFSGHHCGKIRAADLEVGPGLPTTVAALFELAKNDQLQAVVFTPSNSVEGELRGHLWWLH